MEPGIGLPFIFQNPLMDDHMMSKTEQILTNRKAMRELVEFMEEAVKRWII